MRKWMPVLVALLVGLVACSGDSPTEIEMGDAVCQQFDTVIVDGVQWIVANDCLSDST